MMNEKLPPQNPEAESCTLGSIILDTDDEVRPDIFDTLVADDFYLNVNQIIFKAMKSLQADNIPIDLVSLRDMLNKTESLDVVGGVDYLITLAESVPTSANGNYYAKSVKEKSTLRSYIRMAGQLIESAYHPAADLSVIADQAESALLRIAEKKQIVKPEHISVIIPRVVNTVKRRTTHGAEGLATGFRDVDDVVGGLHAGEMIVVAGRPSMGKSILAINIATNVAAAGGAVAVFSLEMSADSLIERHLAAASEVGYYQMQKAFLGDVGITMLESVAAEESMLPLVICDYPKLTPYGLRSQCRILRRSHDIKLVVIDYLQLMEIKGKGNRYEAVGECSRMIKLLARELDIPIVVVCQLNRMADERTNHRPAISDLRESGNLEQDSDTVLLLLRDDYYNKDKARHDGMATLIVAKQRNGPTGDIKLKFEGNNMRFRDAN